MSTIGTCICVTPPIRQLLYLKMNSKGLAGGLALSLLALVITYIAGEDAEVPNLLYGSPVVPPWLFPWLTDKLSSLYVEPRSAKVSAGGIIDLEEGSRLSPSTHSSQLTADRCKTGDRAWP